MANLLAKLCGSPSPVRIPCGDAQPAVALKEFIDDGIVPVLFSDSIGGTELDIMLDPAGCGQGPGVLTLAGSLVLDDVAVRARIEITLDTMTGWGQLFPMQGTS